MVTAISIRRYQTGTMDWNGKGPDRERAPSGVTVPRAILNRYNRRAVEDPMKFPARMAMSVVARMIVLACAYVTVGAWAAEAQTIHVDVTPGHAVAFDPDKAMGTSMDILPAKDFEKVYSEPVI